MDLNAMIDMFIKKLSSTTETTAILQWISTIMIFDQAMLQWKWMMSKDNAILRPMCMHFMRWLIRTNLYDLTRTILYDLSKPQWRVGLGAGLGVGHSYKFIQISNS